MLPHAEPRPMQAEIQLSPAWSLTMYHATQSGGAGGCVTPDVVHTWFASLPSTACQASTGADHSMDSVAQAAHGSTSRERRPESRAPRRKAKVGVSMLTRLPTWLWHSWSTRAKNARATCTVWLL